MAGELQPAIDALDEKKREKTTLTSNLRDAILEETPKVVAGDYFDDKVSTYFEREVEFVNDLAAIKQVIRYAELYKEITNVDILSSLLSIKVGNVKDRVLAAPQEFGLVKKDDDGVVSWNSAGIKIETKKKVRVSRDLT